VIPLQQLVSYCDRRLAVAEFEDYCPNGLQVEAAGGVRRLASGTTLSLALIEAAAAWGADALLVHHGLFWKGEPAALAGIKGRRVAELFRRGISLIAYHLPLDAHAELGNNRQLALRLGFEGGAPLEAAGGLLWAVDLASPLAPAVLTERIRLGLQQPPLHIPVDSEELRRIGWCTGAAASYLEPAALHGCDAYITGEIPEHAVHLAREYGVHLYAAGHHATERYGVQALGEELAATFPIEHRYFEVASPV